MRIDANMPLPQPGSGEVRVRVVAAGVNRPDVFQRMGLYPPPPDASPHLGLEIAGEVDAVGPDVEGIEAGQHVCALVAGGGYADHVCMPAKMLMRVPRGLTPQQAAALPETCMTVWANVFERCALSPGEVFLVHAGASSIGLTAIAMAKAHGATVLTTVSSTAKADICHAAGADAVFLYRDRDWAGEVVDWLETRQRTGVDVVLDMVGADFMAGNLSVMAVEGRLASIAQLSGAASSLDLMRVMLKRLTLTGSTLRARSPEYKQHLSRMLEERVWPALEKGQWRPVIHAVLPVDKVQEAHAILERRENAGKVLLSFD